MTNVCSEMKFTYSLSFAHVLFWKNVFLSGVPIKPEDLALRPPRRSSRKPVSTHPPLQNETANERDKLLTVRFWHQDVQWNIQETQEPITSHFSESTASHIIRYRADFRSPALFESRSRYRESSRCRNVALQRPPLHWRGGVKTGALCRKGP